MGVGKILDLVFLKLNMFMKHRIKVLFGGFFKNHRLQKAIEDPECHLEGLKIYSIYDTASPDKKKAMVSYFYRKNSRPGRAGVRVSGDVSFFIDYSWTE